MHETEATAQLRHLRRLIPDAAADKPQTGGWRDDLKLFAFAWAAGFLFFLVLIG